MRLEPDDIVQADFFPEPVRVIRVQSMGGGLQIEAVGLNTHQYYARMLTADDLQRLQKRSASPCDLSGNPEYFFLAVEAHRIRFAHQFDPYLAVNASQVDPLPHQIDAVYHHILQKPRIRFLLADDPGAGKTIMTGLLIKELKYRGLIRRVLIVVPGHLKDQWQREMKERFGENFLIVDRQVIDASWGRSIWEEQDQVITSMDFAKRDDVLHTLLQTNWDLVVVDEAHKLAAYRYGQKVNKTERYRLGEMLSRNAAYLLFLTATPHRGDEENFRLFLDLLEPDLFATAELVKESVMKGENPLFLRRLKEDLRDYQGRPLFPPRYVHTRTFRLNEDEKRLYNAVTDYVQKQYNQALSAEKRNVAFALLILQRRLASSVRAVRKSLERRKRRLEELWKLGNWLAEDGVDEEEIEDYTEQDRLSLEDELLERLTAAETRDELRAEIATLEELIRLARHAERSEVETKLNELRRTIQSEQLLQHGEKLLIFTESRETLEYLAEKLRSWGYTVVTLHGAMNLDDRIAAEHEFRHSAQVMVCTEAGGEGINLQFCSLMVNYDLPWNPARLEQRMGRIHRYGQQKEVHIYNLVALDTVEGAVFQALFQKLESIRNALGSDRVFDVIGEVLPGKSLKELIIEALSQRRTLDEIIRDIEAVTDWEAIERTRQMTLEALASRHIDLTRVLGEERRARENRLMPEYVEQFFERTCKALGVRVERRRDGVWRVLSVPSDWRNLPVGFKNRYGEVHREYRKIAFDKDVARREEAEFVAPAHPLLEAAIERLLHTANEHLRRGAVFHDPTGRLDGWLWFVAVELRDGRDAVASKRLVAVYQPEGSDELRCLNSSVLWDLEPADALPSPITCPPTDALMAYVADQVLHHLREEVLQQREHTAQIKRKYGLCSLNGMIDEVQWRLFKYEERRQRGENLPDVEITNQERRLEELRRRKVEMEEQIRRETSLLPNPPDILGVARVVPAPDRDSAMYSDREIEAVGMRTAMEYELQQGRRPEDVSQQNCGYDIRSEAPDGGVRYIEVKARARSGDIVLTPNEWVMAQRLGDEYWLYIVETARTAPTLHTVQNPARNLLAEAQTEVVGYRVREWKEQVYRVDE